MSNEIWAEALAAAREIDDEHGRIRTLAAFAPPASPLPPSTIGILWQESLPALARRPRQELLAGLRVLVTPLSAAGGEQAVAATA